VADAQPRHGVHDNAQALHALQRIAPARRLVAVQAIEEVAVPGTAKHRLHLGRERARLVHRPLGKQPRVHHRVRTLDVHQRATAQPLEQRVAIRRIEHLAERVALARAFHARRDAEQVQVVVAEHGHRAIAEVLHEAQACERVGAAIDQVAHEPEAIARAVEADARKEPLERLEAALQVPDRVGRHGVPSQ